MLLAKGVIDIQCTTVPASGGNPAQTLAGAEKLNPGWLSNVNCSDNDNDGWNPSSTKTTTADPAAIYTPDAYDDLVPGGDPDLRKFVISVSDLNNTPNPNYSFRLTWDSSVRIYLNQDKSGMVEPNGATTHDFNNGDMTIIELTASKIFWLEGYHSSDSFRDIELKADYIGVNIPLMSNTDTVKVTVFGVEQTGIFTGAQQADDPILHSTTVPKGSKDENGQISWDLQKYIDLKTNTGIDYCAFFHDCMEMQGSVKPPRDANPSAYYGLATHPNDPTIPEAPPPFPAPPPGFVAFEQHRDAYVAAWKKAEGGEWTVKDIPGYTATSSGSHIYFIDNPGYNKKDHSVGLDYLVYYANLRNAAFIKFYGGSFQVSVWARWHTKIDLIPKDANTLTRHPGTQIADFGGGWINVPNNLF